MSSTSNAATNPARNWTTGSKPKRRSVAPKRLSTKADLSSATTLSGPRRLIYEAHHNAHKRPLDQFAYGQFQRQFPADLDRTVIDPNKSANHEDTEQQAKSSPFADVALDPADPGIDRREYQDRREDAAQSKRHMVLSRFT